MGIAKIEGGAVAQIDRTTDEAPEGWIVCGDDIVCGMLWDGSEFSNPPPGPAPAPRWSSLQFIERFTEAEQIAIVTAAAASPALRLWYDKAMAADEIIADDPRTVAGLQALVDAGMLTSQRRDEVLGA